MKRVGVVVIVLAISASVALGLSQDAATRRTLKAVEFKRSSAEAALCDHLTNTNLSGMAYGDTIPGDPFGFGLPPEWWLQDTGDTLSSDANALRDASDMNLSTIVDSLATHVRHAGVLLGYKTTPILVHSRTIKGIWTHFSHNAANQIRADLDALPPSMCSGASRGST